MTFRDQSPLILGLKLLSLAVVWIFSGSAIVVSNFCTCDELNPQCAKPSYCEHFLKPLQYLVENAPGFLRFLDSSFGASVLVGSGVVAILLGAFGRYYLSLMALGIAVFAFCARTS